MKLKRYRHLDRLESLLTRYPVVAILLSKARTNLRTAQHAYEHSDFDSCVSRAYFAVFYIEIASLLKLTSFAKSAGDTTESKPNLTAV